MQNPSFPRKFPPRALADPATDLPFPRRQLEMMHVRSRDLPGGYVLNHSPYRDGFVASEPLAFPGKDLEDGSVVSVRDPLWQAMCLMCSMPPPVARRAPDGLASPSSKASTSAEEYVPGRGTLTAKLYEQLKVKSEKLKRKDRKSVV